MKLADFDAAAEEGLVTRKDDGHLSLYTYTNLCTYKKIWTPVTRAARGIVFNRVTGCIVARPFDKFFNLGEMDEVMPDVLPTNGFTVDEKLDGSLGIAFHDGDRWRMNTKGSFNSKQAQWGEAQLAKLTDIDSACGLTLLFELIYPDNRIVVDYGQRVEMVLLSVRYTFGYEASPGTIDAWADKLGVARPARYTHRNLLDLPMSESLDMEGYVVRFADGRRVKIKSPRYVKVHRLLEYTSPRRVLEMLGDESYEHMRAQIPDEIAKDFDDVAASLRLSMFQLQAEADRVFDEIMPATDRKAFAMAAQEKADPRVLGMLFARLDNRPTLPLLVRAVRKGLAEEIRS